MPACHPFGILNTTTIYSIIISPSNNSRLQYNINTKRLLPRSRGERLRISIHKVSRLLVRFLSNNITGEYHQNEPTTKILHSSSSIFFKQQQQQKEEEEGEKK